MTWTIRIELTPDGNEPITRDVGTITRPIVDLSPEQIGLTLEEGQQPLRRVQIEMIASQAHAYALCRRPCEDCGQPRRIKDTRTKCVQTVFGAFRFRGRRAISSGIKGASDLWLWRYEGEPHGDPVPHAGNWPGTRSATPCGCARPVGLPI